METRKPDGVAGGEGSRNILVRPAERIDRAAICRTFFEEADSPQTVVVSYEQSIEEWLSDHRRTPLESVAFVSVGETVRSTTTTAPTEPTIPGVPMDGPLLEGVADPTDLTTLGLTVLAHLRNFEDSESGKLVVCFDSLTALVDGVSLRQAFRFLHVLTNLISAYGATAHYHYDPSLPAEDLETLRVLFDAELDTHNSLDANVWTLESRPSPSADGPQP